MNNHFNDKISIKNKKKYKKYKNIQLKLERKKNKKELQYIRSINRENKYIINLNNDLTNYILDNRPNLFIILPFEIILNIFDELDVVDFLNIRLVCKEFYDISNYIIYKIYDPIITHIKLYNDFEKNEKYYKLYYKHIYMCECDICIYNNENFCVNIKCITCLHMLERFSDYDSDSDDE